MIGHLHLKNWRLAGLAGHLPRSSASSSWSLAEFLIIYFTTVILSLEDVALLILDSDVFFEKISYFFAIALIGLKAEAMPKKTPG